MTSRLRDLIKSVRSCKTAADERAEIQKESAAIRTAFKEDAAEYRHRNVAKLLYINMLGYPTAWGQMECLKLISSPSYSDKRIGYLALMLLLDEKQEVLTLVTNSLKNDLNHLNQFIAGLAMCTLGNIASAGMARDLAPEIEKLLSSANPYLRKKAALCAIRVLRKCPDLMENFVPRIRALLGERNHGVLLTGVTLMVECIELDPDANVEHFRKLVPTLVRILKNLVMSGYAPEYDVSGVTDPFLQVKILKLLRLLGKGDQESSDVMNDILAQVATNTDHTRNVGNTILYECVQTIMSIEAENGLRVLAINVLGRFLQNRDNNIRYVALNTLSKVVNTDVEAVQRHRNTIVDCLKDPDISIRRRAVELIYALVNESNIKILAQELLTFLTTATVEFRADLAAKLCRVTEKHAPNKRWHVDTILKIMGTAGNYVPDEVASNLVALIAATPDLQSYSAQKMYIALANESSHQILVQVAVWTIGEFGDLLVAPGSEQEIVVTEKDTIDTLERILKNSSPITKEYVVTALFKLTARFSSEHTGRLQALIEKQQGSIDVELQQRACEYTRLFQTSVNKKALLARMPVLEERARSAGAGHDSPAIPQASAQPASKSLIEDWDDPAPAAAQKTVAPAAAPAAPAGGIDLMAELFGGSSPAAAPAPAPTPSAGGLGGLEALFGGPATPAPAPAPVPQAAPAGPRGPLNFVAYQRNGITINFNVLTNPAQPNMHIVNATFVSSLPTAVQNFDFKAAVPKYVKLQVNPPTGTTLLPGAPVTQQVKLLNQEHGSKPLLMKLKLDYVVNGAPASEMADVSFQGL
eukprot:TRINITY_DN7106_c0_g1_i1.p1 TRINITY_DN7106_c0_g1~~TRINITY_DN7106_c0_g1_i1.p1  ORF type:complete len:812 (+),score=368.44 TRINITY_DN7106_c0_g1_i1:73-2508(+)